MSKDKVQLAEGGKIMKNVIADGLGEALEALERIEIFIPEDESNFYDDFVAIIHKLEDLKEEAEA